MASGVPNLTQISSYKNRLLEPWLKEIMAYLPAIAIDGPKAVGKTVTASRLARTVFQVDTAHVQEALENEPGILATAQPPVLIDEWQYLPQLWNTGRRNVDIGVAPGTYLLAGSAYPESAAIHSGAGRIVHVRMRPLSLQERELDTPCVRIANCIDGKQDAVNGQTQLTAKDYIHEIARSGFPALWAAPQIAAGLQLESYLDNIISRDIKENGHVVRKPESMRRWLKAFAAASGTSASYSEILDAATPGEKDKPAKSTTTTYRDVLQSIWILDEVPMWTPAEGVLSRLKQTPKHFLADPALAVRLLDLDEEMLLGEESETRFDEKYGTLTGRLFESLIGMSLQTYALVNNAKLGYLRTQNGDHEVDFIIHKGRRIVAIEVKFSPTVTDSDTNHLRWLKKNYPAELMESIVITTGQYVYRREKDGVLVIPAALLGA